MGVGAHAQIAHGCEIRDEGNRVPVFIEEIVGLVTSKPSFKSSKLCWVFARFCKRDLMRSKGAFELFPIERSRASPALWSFEDDHGPEGPGQVAMVSGTIMNIVYLRMTHIKGSCESLVDFFGVIPFDKERQVAIALEKVVEFFSAYA